MAETVYLLCALTSVVCATMLIRGFLKSRVRLLLWASICFIGLACNNVLLFADFVVFPGIQLLLRALERREAQELRAHFLPMDARYPSIAAWMRRVEALPGYDRTFPPHWRG